TDRFDRQDRDYRPLQETRAETFTLRLHFEYIENFRILLTNYKRTEKTWNNDKDNTTMVQEITDDNWHEQFARVGFNINSFSFEEVEFIRVLIRSLDQFGKRDGHRPLQFGKKSFRPLQFGKRGMDEAPDYFYDI
ncbi:hypothetical protein LOAG_08769, partial [Loa loa]